MKKVFWQDFLEKIGAEEKVEKRSNKWRTYKYNNITLLLNTEKNRLILEDNKYIINSINDFNFLFLTNFNEKNFKKIEEKTEQKKDNKDKILEAVKLARRWDKSAEKFKNNRFEKDVRGIKKEILNYFVEQINIIVANKVVMFPINSRYGMTGIYQIFKDLKTKKIFIKNSIKGLIALNPKKAKITDKVVIGESIIDVLSYVQLKNIDYKNCLMLSTGGNLGKDATKTLEKLRDKILYKNNKNVQIILTFDNDEAGKKFTEKVKEIFKNFNVITDFPNLKDWNDELQTKISKKEGLFLDL